MLASVTEGMDMSKPSALVQGTLDMLLLKILALEPMNGFAVSQRLKQVSGDGLAGERRVLVPGSAQAGARGLDYSRVENFRVWAAREILFADTAGRRQLEKEADNWGRLSSAISRVIKLKEA